MLSDRIAGIFFNKKINKSLLGRLVDQHSPVAQQCRNLVHKCAPILGQQNSPYSVTKYDNIVNLTLECHNMINSFGVALNPLAAMESGAMKLQGWEKSKLIVCPEAAMGIPNALIKEDFRLFEKENRKKTYKKVKRCRLAKALQLSRQTPNARLW